MRALTVAGAAGAAGIAGIVSVGQWAADHGIPEPMARAYVTAAADWAPEGCGLSPFLLAGVGHIESGHGTSGGAVAGPDGTVTPRIVGPALDGTRFKRVADTDGGQLDGDTRHDRAVGPMQFLPGTWATWGVDASGDGRVDPQNGFDSAAAAGRMLCSAGGDLTTPDGVRRALWAYNRSTVYADQVVAAAERLAGGVGGVQIDRAAAPAGAARPTFREAVEHGYESTVGAKLVDRGWQKVVDGWEALWGPATRNPTSEAVYGWADRRVDQFLDDAHPDAGEADSPTVPGAPVELVDVRGITIAAQLAPRLEALLAAADTDGVSLSGWGWRSHERQIELRRAHCGTSHYEVWEAPASSCHPPTARPGWSRHETGRAVDFTAGGRVIGSRDTREFRWLAANAPRYGFHNLPSEPWHWSDDGR